MNYSTTTACAAAVVCKVDIKLKKGLEETSINS